MNTSGTCCLVCGCVEVVKERGFFFCLECQTQREGYCDQVFQNGDEDQDVEYDALDSKSLLNEMFIGRRRRKPSKKKGDDFTSWEMFNFVLRGQVEELITLGAPSSIKITVLQLWTYYLHKLEAAFVSKNEITYPKLSVGYNQRDAELLYGVKRKRRGKGNLKGNINLNTISEPNDWNAQQMQKYLQRRRKRAMMTKISELSVMSNIGCESCAVNETDIVDKSLNLTELESCIANPEEESTTAVPTTIQFNSRAQKVLETRADISTLKCSSLVITRDKLLKILYLALLYEGVDIHISDLIRWVREGHLSFFEVSHFLPENCFIQGNTCTQFKLTSHLPKYAHFCTSTSEMAKVLDFIDWPLPDVSKLVEKYVKELQLPMMFQGLILQVFHLIPTVFGFKKGYVIPNYEGRVLAVLIIIMKILFGLDGKTEHTISTAASKLNEFLILKKSKKRKKLFVWNDWVKQLICRNAVVTKHHFHTKHLICPETYENPELFINCWKERASKETNKKYLWGQVYLKDTEPALMNFFNNVLEKLHDPNYMKKVSIDFPPSCYPFYSYTKKILEKCAVEDSLVTTEAQNILGQDFSSCDITYLLTPSLLNGLADKSDHCLKIIQESAQKSFCNYKLGNKFVNKKTRVRKQKSCIAVTHVKKYSTQGNKSFIDISDKKRNETASNVQKLLDKARLSLSGTKRKQNESTSKIQKLLDKARLSLTGAKRKRKNGTTRKAKKRKKENQKNKSKTLKLYTPFTQYWVLHDERNFNEEEFDSEIYIKFPFAFSWLLSECALISEMTNVVLYKEVVNIEKHLKDHFLNAET